MARVLRPSTVTAAVTAALAATVAIAPAAEASDQIWTATFIQARAAPERGLVGWLDLHGRRRDDAFAGIVRPGLGYAFSPALSVFAGYAYVPTLVDDGADRREQRLWQQAIVTRPVGGTTTVAGRIRLEQRMACSVLASRVSTRFR